MAELQALYYRCTDWGVLLTLHVRSLVVKLLKISTHTQVPDIRIDLLTYANILLVTMASTNYYMYGQCSVQLL
jgi:hypothetical protein